MFAAAQEWFAPAQRLEFDHNQMIPNACYSHNLIFLRPKLAANYDNDLSLEYCFGPAQRFSDALLDDGAMGLRTFDIFLTGQV